MGGAALIPAPGTDKERTEPPLPSTRDHPYFLRPEALRFETADKSFSLKLGGRVMTDFGWMREDSNIRSAFGRIEDHEEFRRLRLYGAGRIGQSVDYKVEVEFAGTGETLKDGYLGFRELLPMGYLKIGHFKEPFSLGELTSSNHIALMERAVPVQALAPSRNAGVQLSNHLLHDRLTWAAGVFRDVDNDIRGLSESDYNLTFRLTGLPWYEDEGARLLHLGLAASQRDPTSHGGTTRFDSRPDLHLAPKFADTGSLPTDDATLLGAEAVVVCGPFSLQTEYIRAHVDLTDSSAGADLHGAYAEASYFLTGEHREYKRPAGGFSGVHPKRPWGEGGLGAWQVAVRYGYVDLNNGPTRGGELRQCTFGLNWHLNANTRVMLNYANARVHGVGGADLFGVRLQIHF
jgi:phosphate-selective porin OprO/OprP